MTQIIDAAYADQCHADATRANVYLPKFDLVVEELKKVDLDE